jgi:H+-translocating NAD(P) transhydrogenase subunit beta
MGHNTSNLLYLVTIVTFVWALRDLSNPARARRGVRVGAAGMVLAIATTFGQHGLHD